MCFVDIPTPTGSYKCEYTNGFYGELCQFTSYGFHDDSFAELYSIGTTSFDIEIAIATKSADSLLLLQAGSDNDKFMALQVVDGSLRFIFKSGSQREGLTVSKVKEV